jgi:hypothetical protein
VGYQKKEATLMALHHPRDDKWHLLAEQVSKETDHQKLQTLIAQLCEALDERLNTSQERQTDAKAS